MAGKIVSGIISAIRRGGSAAGNLYTLITDDLNVYCIKSEAVLEMMDTVKTTTAALKSGTLAFASCEVVGKASEREYRKTLDSLFSRVRGKMADMEEMTGVPKGLAKAVGSIRKELRGAADELVRRYVSGAPIVVRFHNDCDGSSGALGIYLAIENLLSACGLPEMNLFWRMNKSIAYTELAYNEDSFLFGSISSAEKPVILILDFGTSAESEAQIISAYGKFDIMVLDHHPVYEGFPKDKIPRCINTWLFGGDSDFTAGFLGCVFAEHISHVDKINDIMMSSLIGDFSKHRDRSKVYADRLAIVLDYLTSLDGTPGAPVQKVVPKSIAQFISDKKKFDETYSHAVALLNDSLDRGERFAKRYRSAASDIYLVDFSDAASPDSKYPLPGRYSSRLHERFEGASEKGAITLVHYGNFISVRMSRSLLGTVSLIGVMENLKQESDDVYSFGGHECAFGIKTDKSHIDKVAKLLLKRLGANPE
jgi:RecJ-like exonuclease